ncbi:MAG: undecaprenyl diphosphate synthase family protein, partial [Desulfuromonadales bacterium]
GVETVREIVEESRSLGISCLTLYAFSSENWGRPRNEVNALMGLLGRYLKSELETMLARKIRLKVIGEMVRLPSGVREVLEEAIERTSGNEEMVLNLALSYGARDELQPIRNYTLRILSGLISTEGNFTGPCASMGSGKGALVLPEPR